MVVRKRVATPSQHEAKRQHILSAAAKEFARLGYDQANINVIADVAEVGKGTMYRYFADKEQLFLDVLSEIAFHTLEAVTTTLADTEGKPVTARLEAIFQAVVLLKQQYPDFINVQLRATYGSSGDGRAETLTVELIRTLTNMFEVFFRGEMQAGRIRQSDPHKLAIFLVTQIHSYRRVSELLGESGPNPGGFIGDLLWRGLKPA